MCRGAFGSLCSLSLSLCYFSMSLFSGTAGSLCPRLSRRSALVSASSLLSSLLSTLLQSLLCLSLTLHRLRLSFVACDFYTSSTLTTVREYCTSKYMTNLHFTAMWLNNNVKVQSIVQSNLTYTTYYRILVHFV